MSEPQPGWAPLDPQTQPGHLTTPVAFPVRDAPGYRPPSTWVTSQFTDVTALSWAVITLSGFTLLSDAISAATAPSAVAAYDAALVAGTDPADVVTAHDLVGLLDLVVLPLWIITSLWLAAVHANADRIVPPAGRRSRVWAWLGWIVPIISFWYPKEVVDESWTATASKLPPGSPLSRVRPTGTWWGLWVAYVLLGNTAPRLNLTSDAAHHGVQPILEVVVVLVGIPALVAWILVVRRISAVQAALARGASTS